MQGGIAGISRLRIGWSGTAVASIPRGQPHPGSPVLNSPAYCTTVEETSFATGCTTSSPFQRAQVHRGCPKSTGQPMRIVSERQRVAKSVPAAAPMPVRRHARRPRIKLEYTNRPSPAARHAVQPRCISARRAKPSRLRRFHTWQTSAGCHSCTRLAIRGHRVAFADGGYWRHARVAARRSRHCHAFGTASAAHRAITQDRPCGRCARARCRSRSLANSSKSTILLFRGIANKLQPKGVITCLQEK